MNPKDSRKRDTTADSQKHNKKFKYGNYNRYYGYRNANKEDDKRISIFQEEWFRNKKCLDIGCNVGHLTIWVAKYFEPASIIGVDIDCELIKAARNNIVNYLNPSVIDEGKSNSDVIDITSHKLNQTNKELIDTGIDIPSKIEKLEGECIMRTSERENTSAVKDTENIVVKNCLAVKQTEKDKTHDVSSTDVSVNNFHNSSAEEKALPSDINTENSSQNQRNTKNLTSNIIENPHSGESKYKNVIDNAESQDNNKNIVIKSDNKDDESDLICQTKSATEKPTGGDNQDKCRFPYNVKFITENFAPASLTVLKYVKEEYDTILCMSVTKWIQLNFGDDRLKWAFHKVYKQLRPCGKFILEPQPYNSYKRRKTLSEEIRKNYDNMKFFPYDFKDYLLNEVGFKTVQSFHVAPHDKAGFQRPVYVFTKG